MNRTALFGISVLALLLAIAAALFLPPLWEQGPTAGPRSPAVTWTPESLVVTLSPNETKTLEATAQITGELPATRVEVVPSLRPYVTVTPDRLPPLDDDDDYGDGRLEQIFTVVAAVPDETEFQTIEGVLQIRVDRSDDDDDDANRRLRSTEPSEDVDVWKRGRGATIASPLPILINVVPETAEGTLAYLAELLIAGSIDNALEFFDPSQLNQDALRSLDNNSRQQLADVFRKAQLLREIDDVRIFVSSATGPDGREHPNAEFSLARTDQGRWMIINW